MKKIVALLLVLGMCISLDACSKEDKEVTPSDTEASTEASTVANTETDTGSDTAKYTESFKIGIIEDAANNESSIRKDYLEEYIGPYFNCEFIQSEGIDNSTDMIAAIENFADAGCDAVMDFYVQDAETAVRYCEDLGMIYEYNGTYKEGVVDAGYSNFYSYAGADQKITGANFGAYIKENASKDGSEGFLICSINACNGNEAHKEIAVAVLEALQENYGLTYNDTIQNLATIKEGAYIENDKNLKIYVYPGNSSKDTWLPNVSDLLLSGDFGYMITANQAYTDAAQIISDAEESLKKDISVLSVANLGDQLNNAFETLDSFGNPSINLGSVKFTSFITGLNFAITYNILTKQIDCLQADGKPFRFTFVQYPITSLEEVQAVNSWDDAATGTWVMKTDMIEQMLGINNPSIMYLDIQNTINSVTIDSIKNSMKQ